MSARPRTNETRRSSTTSVVVGTPVVVGATVVDVATGATVVAGATVVVVEPLPEAEVDGASVADVSEAVGDEGSADSAGDDEQPTAIATRIRGVER
jgi:energy-converting hydrogenase Eha subunit A